MSEVKSGRSSQWDKGRRGSRCNRATAIYTVRGENDGAKNGAAVGESLHLEDQQQGAVAALAQQ